MSTAPPEPEAETPPAAKEEAEIDPADFFGPVILKPKSKADLKKLALDIVDGKIFGSWMVGRAADIPMAFMILNFMGKGTLGANVAEIYEYYSKAGPRGVNGMPCFFSCCLLAREDIEPLQGYIESIQEFRASFMNDTPPTPTAPETAAVEAPATVPVQDIDDDFSDIPLAPRACTLGEECESCQ